MITALSRPSLLAAALTVSAPPGIDSADTATARPRGEPGRLQRPARVLLKPFFRAMWRINIEGHDHIPPTGPALIAPNHISFIDSVFLLSVLPRRTLAVGKAEYMDSWKTRHLFPAIGMIPLDRTGGSASEGALDQAAGVLDNGDLFLIFPEGTRSRDGYLHRGRTGVARLALRTGAPIIPVGIEGTDSIQPPGASVPKPFRSCSIRFGRPISVDKYRDSAFTRAVLRSLTDEVMYEIGQLSGQTYVDTYGNESRGEDAPVDAPAPTSEVRSG